MVAVGHAATSRVSTASRMPPSLSAGALCPRRRVRIQESQRKRPGFGRSLGVIARARIAEESMIRVRKLDVDPCLLRLAQGTVDPLDLIRSDMLIETAPEKEHGRAELFQ